LPTVRSILSKLTGQSSGIDIHRHLATMVKTKKFIYAKAFEGEPKETDFKLVEEELSALKDGEVLSEAIFHSVDPYMRPYMARYPVGVTMIGGQIAKVIESKNKAYPVGSTIFGQFGWQTHTIFNPSESKDPLQSYVLPSFGKNPSSLGLGVLGMPGNTAYFGFLEICQPKAGEVVAVSGAAGAVGTLVGQIAKLKGCKVIGFAGSDDKCAWLKNDLGFDNVINYKTENVSKALRAAAPDGVDCYFDNVGGEISSQIIQQMKDYGRIAVCGSISSYNLDIKDMPQVPILQPIFVFKQLKMEGFLVWRYADKWMEGIKQMSQWVDLGKIKYHETTTDGFKNIPKAFIDMLRGGNTGKAIVKSSL